MLYQSLPLKLFHTGMSCCLFGCPFVFLLFRCVWLQTSDTAKQIQTARLWQMESGCQAKLQFSHGKRRCWKLPCVEIPSSPNSRPVCRPVCRCVETARYMLRAIGLCELCSAEGSKALRKSNCKDMAPVKPPKEFQYWCASRKVLK